MLAPNAATRQIRRAPTVIARCTATGFDQWKRVARRKQLYRSIMKSGEQRAIAANCWVVCEHCLRLTPVAFVP
jgi:hypothetical protein